MDPGEEFRAEEVASKYNGPGVRTKRVFSRISTWSVAGMQELRGQWEEMGS